MEDESTQNVHDRRCNPLLRALTDLGRYKDQPTLAIILTHGFVDRIVNVLVAATYKHAKRIKGINKLIVLHEKGVISDHTFVLLDWLCKLRNDAAHDPFFTLTPERLDIFAMSKHRRVENFADLCRYIVFDLFVQHQELLSQELLPTPSDTVDTPTLMMARVAPIENIPLVSDTKVENKRALDEWNEMREIDADTKRGMDVAGDLEEDERDLNAIREEREAAFRSQRA